MKKIQNIEFKLGVILLFLCVIQAVFKLQWGWFAGIQTSGTFKAISGLMLAFYIAYHWKLTKVRTQTTSNSKLLRDTLMNHKLWGIFGPVFFLLHTQKWGYNYLFWLSMSFFSVFALGVFHEKLMKIKKPWVTHSTILAHICISTAMIGLIGYHVFISINY